ncbi:nuclear pore protein-like protein, partial [Colletotrichum sojae]
MQQTSSSDNMNPFYTPPRDTVFDKYGDLTLKVGEPPTNYQVSSTVLAGASPVFDAMLNGGFMQSGPGIGDWVVRLPADGAKE